MKVTASAISNLTIDEKKIAIESGIEKAIKKWQKDLQGYEVKWSNYSCDFKVTVLNHFISGAIKIFASHCTITVSIPDVLFIFRAKIKTTLLKEFEKVLTSQ